MLQICRCSCEKNLKTVVGSGKPFELCFLSQWILKVQPCGSENILYFIWKWWKWPGIWWKTHVLVGWTSPALFHLLNLWGQCWGRWQIILTCQGGISLKDSCASSCVSLYLLEGSLAGYWVLGPGHLSPSLPLLPLCLPCAMRLVMVVVEAQQRPY